MVDWEAMSLPEMDAYALGITILTIELGYNEMD